MWAAADMPGAYSAGEVVYDTRERLCRLFHAPKPQNVIFTSNITRFSQLYYKRYAAPRRPCIGQLDGAQRHDAPLGTNGKTGRLF